MTEVYNNLFLGGCEESKDYNFLKGNKITHILSAGPEFENVFQFQFEYKILMDKNGDSWDYNEIADFINQGVTGKKRVYVHCGSGKGRASACVIAYLLKYEKCTLQQALSMIRVKFPCASPRQCFLDQLEAFYKQLNQTDEEPVPLGVETNQTETSNIQTTQPLGGETITLRTYQEKTGQVRPKRTRNIKHTQAKKPTGLYTQKVNKKYNQTRASMTGRGGRVGYINPKSQSLLNDPKQLKKHVYQYQATQPIPRICHSTVEAKQGLYDRYTLAGKERLHRKKRHFPQVVQITHNPIGRQVAGHNVRYADHLRKTGSYLETQRRKNGYFGF